MRTKRYTICVAFVIVMAPAIMFAGWQSLNGPPAGRADDMSIGWDPEFNYWAIFATDRTHKLYKSVNEGEYWDSIPTAIPNPNIINPTCVITRPNNAQVVYIGRNYSTPVWKSIDGGETWDPKSTGITNTRPLCFAMDPNNASIVYLGCEEFKDEPVLFRTTDGGWEWDDLNLSNCNINDILVLNLSYEGIILFLATDRGILKGRPYQDFELVEDANFLKLKFDKRARKIYVKGVDKVWVSDDGGKRWQVYESDKPIDLFGLEHIIKQRRQ